MHNPVPHIILSNIFWMSPDRSLFWEEENTLIITDLHLGKSGHFRKEGIAIPQKIYTTDLQRLMAALYLYKAERLIVVGDFSHSTMNKELDLFLRWRKDFSQLQIDLVKGNHDILEEQWYKDGDIIFHPWQLEIGKFCFRHEDKRHEKKYDATKALYTFSGHVHPAYLLKGKGKQSLKFPCYYFKKDSCILPAFSHFTGNFLVTPQKEENVFAIVENAIMKLA
jgi:DNA ligase-associated metallophosphoesterase